jgi:hypothetical protein
MFIDTLQIVLGGVLRAYVIRVVSMVTVTELYFVGSMKQRVIPVFCRCVNEFFTFLGCYAALIVTYVFGTTCRPHLNGPSRPEASATTYQRCPAFQKSEDVGMKQHYCLCIMAMTRGCRLLDGGYITLEVGIFCFWL